MEQENYYKVMDMTDEEKRETYMKLPKEELVDMLIQSNKITAMLTGPKTSAIETHEDIGIIGTEMQHFAPVFKVFKDVQTAVAVLTKTGQKVLILASGEKEAPRMDDAGLGQLLENIQRDAARRLDELAYCPTFDDLDKKDKWKKNKYHMASRPRR